MTQRKADPHVDFDNPDYNRYKWCLDCFDKVTEELVRTHELPITTGDARRVLKRGPGRSIVGGFPLTKAAADRLNDTLDDKIAFDLENFEYVIELCDTGATTA
ncbi:hypothetical protein [Mesorhizobium sp.]|jgi:hypothetical protein|nr:hypothetical protein [Mesorhizobium sp.]RWQ02091.1 MAG: hypothetical protein EOR89_12175 [Mesorhizobium sp.]RWQ51875.1 MAG: hypothetical protein EOS82_12020 [Mesorhizobium sp.]